MAQTNTGTSTLTLTRMLALQSQVRIALRRSALINETAMEALMKGLDNQWIEVLKVYALDSTNLCKGELRLRIDWKTYGLEMSKGNATVVIDHSVWQDGASIEVDEIVRLFNTYVKKNQLRTHWVVNYQPHLNVNEINKELGFHITTEPTWAKTPTVNAGTVIEELSELKIGYRLVE